MSLWLHRVHVGWRPVAVKLMTVGSLLVAIVVLGAAWPGTGRAFWWLAGALTAVLPAALTLLDQRRRRDLPRPAAPHDRLKVHLLRFGQGWLAWVTMVYGMDLGVGLQTGQWELALVVLLGQLPFLIAVIVLTEVQLRKQRHAVVPGAP